VIAHPRTGRRPPGCQAARIGALGGQRIPPRPFAARGSGSGLASRACSLLPQARPRPAWCASRPTGSPDPGEMPTWWSTSARLPHL